MLYVAIFIRFCGYLNMIFQLIIRCFEGMGVPGFCNVEQNENDIRH